MDSISVSNKRNTADLTDPNRRNLLNFIRERGPITRRELAGLCALSTSTTKRLLEVLLREGLVQEQTGGAPHESVPRRGRKAQGLRLNAGFAHAVGANIEPGLLELCAVDLEGGVLAQQRCTLSEPRPEPVLALLVEEVRRLAETLRAQGRKRLLGVGVGVAGVINAREGQVLFCPNLPAWENFPLGERLRAQLETEILVDDGVRCMALAEKRYGLAKNLANFLYLYLGLGVGAGIVLDNRFYRGSNGLAGEFGHITVAADGPLCNCGNRGCLEVMASRMGILSAVRALVASNVYSGLAERVHSGEQLSLKDIEEAAESGDKLANMVIHGVGESIGTGVADLVNIFDPGVVVLGGEVIERFGDHLIEGINRTVRLRGIHSITQKTRILTSRLGAPSSPVRETAGVFDSPAARGAATMVLERFLGSDLLNL